MSTRMMIESMCGIPLLCKAINDAWDFLEDLGDKTYNIGTIMESYSIESKVLMDNDGKLANDFVAFDNTMLYCEFSM